MFVISPQKSKSKKEMNDQKSFEYDSDMDTVDNTQKDKRKLDLCMFCFNAGFVFSDIQKLNPKSVIITSGTISPFDTLEYELEAKFKFQFSGSHVIKSNQILPIVCSQGASET